MNRESIVFAVVIGAAMIALWLHVRFPAALPETTRARVAHVVAALGLLALSPALMQLVPGAGEHAAPATVALLGIFLPALAYAFLNAIWFMQVVQRRLPVG